VRQEPLLCPGKKSLYQSDALMNSVVIDVTESRIERQKKTKAIL
jgi:hypothetical protein